MLTRGEFNADVLCGITIVLAHLRKDGFRILHARVKEGIDFQSLTYLFLQDGTSGFPLLGIVIFRSEVIEHLFALVLVATGIFVEFDLIEVAALFPPIPIEMFADIIERLFEGIGTDAEVCISEHDARRIDIGIEFELDVESFGDIVHHLTHRSAILRLVGLRSSSEQWNNG